MRPNRADTSREWSNDPRGPATTEADLPSALAEAFSPERVDDLLQSLQGLTPLPAESDSDTDTESDPEADLETESEPAPEPSPEVELLTTPAPEIEIEPEPEPEPVAAPAPAAEIEEPSVEAPTEQEAPPAPATVEAFEAQVLPMNPMLVLFALASACLGTSVALGGLAALLAHLVW